MKKAVANEEKSFFEPLVPGVRLALASLLVIRSHVFFLFFFLPCWPFFAFRRGCWLLIGHRKETYIDSKRDLYRRLERATQTAKEAYIDGNSQRVLAIDWSALQTRIGSRGVNMKPPPRLFPSCYPFVCIWPKP